jgi:polar amino acid transport system permease protein
MQTFSANFLSWDATRDYLPDLLAGLWVTIQLTLIIVASGLICGTALALVRTLRVRALDLLIVLFADVTRAVPPLMLLVVVYFGLPYFGVRLGGFAVASIVLGTVLAAFTEELIWAGLTTIAAGQWEAARSTGLSFMQMMLSVILPQAFRLVLAPLTSRIIATTKNTALASVVAVPELLSQANAAQGYSGNASPLTAASLGYLIILLPMVIAARRLERPRRAA